MLVAGALLQLLRAESSSLFYACYCKVHVMRRRSEASGGSKGQGHCTMEPSSGDAQGREVPGM